MQMQYQLPSLAFLYSMCCVCSITISSPYPDHCYRVIDAHDHRPDRLYIQLLQLPIIIIYSDHLLSQEPCLTAGITSSLPFIDYAWKLLYVFFNEAPYCFNQVKINSIDLCRIQACISFLKTDTIIFYHRFHLGIVEVYPMIMRFKIGAAKEMP